MSQPFPLVVSENLHDSIRGVSEKEWNMFFDSLRTMIQAPLESVDQQGLTEIQSKSKMISELRGIILTLRKTQTKES